MNSKEKAEMLKDTIYMLYTKEGRSKSYIARLLMVNRKTVSEKITEWGFAPAEPRRHATPRVKKWLARNKTQLLRALATDASETQIANDLHTDCHFISHTLAAVDDDIAKALNEHRTRYHAQAKEQHIHAMQKSKHDYNIETIDGEIWKPIIGYSRYEISSEGRIRKYIPTHDAYQLIQPHFNERINYYYVKLVGDNGNTKNLKLSRIVAASFCDGQSKIANTVNHKDGNTKNDRAENLEWVSQSDNNRHSYAALNRQKVRTNTASFHRVIYQNKYEFKTVAALARFLGKSETQTRRYLEEPEKHNLTIIPKR